jgi:hypothetical protein
MLSVYWRQISELDAAVHNRRLGAQASCHRYVPTGGDRWLCLSGLHAWIRCRSFATNSCSALVMSRDEFAMFLRVRQCSTSAGTFGDRALKVVGAMGSEVNRRQEARGPQHGQSNEKGAMGGGLQLQRAHGLNAPV